MKRRRKEEGDRGFIVRRRKWEMENGKWEMSRRDGFEMALDGMRNEE